MIRSLFIVPLLFIAGLYTCDNRGSVDRLEQGEHITIRSQNFNLPYPMPGTGGVGKFIVLLGKGKR